VVTSREATSEGVGVVAVFPFRAFVASAEVDLDDSTHGAGVDEGQQGRQKHRGSSEKQFFMRKNGADGVFVFSPFSPGRCAEPVSTFWVNFCVFNGKFRQHLRDFHHFFYRLRRY
jgi:phenylpropionate dioxygenase-like ring-hydroxylating dioxygenase large terminal subunit